MPVRSARAGIVLSGTLRHATARRAAVFLRVMASSIGTFTELGRGSLVRVLLFRHGPGDHRDPREEVLDASSLVVTSHGAWTVRGVGVDGVADLRTCWVGGRGAAYRCHHPRRPTDRTLAIDVLAAGTAEAIPDLPAGRSALIVRTPELEGRRARVVSAALARSPGSRLALDVAASELFAIAWARAGASHGSDGDRRAGRLDDLDRIDVTLRWLDGRLADDVGLRDLASVAGMSPFHFVRAFHARTGETPMRHVRRRRLEHAAVLLRETDRSVTEIALDAGFGSLSHFVTVFRDLTGLPPQRWRRARDRRACDRPA